MKNVYKQMNYDVLICGSPAGCSQCEFQENCDIQNVSPLCICIKCSDDKNAFDSCIKNQQENNSQFLNS